MISSAATTFVRGLSLLAVIGSLSAAPPAKDQATVKPSTHRTLRLPKAPDRYADVELPVHFRTPAARRLDNTPFDNPVTDAGATLGRVLSYDTRLSANSTVACAARSAHADGPSCRPSGSK